MIYCYSLFYTNPTNPRTQPGYLVLLITDTANPLTVGRARSSKTKASPQWDLDAFRSSDPLFQWLELTIADADKL